MQGKFSDRTRLYQVFAEQGSFVKLSDGQKSGWVFRLDLAPVQAAAPVAPKLQTGGQPHANARDPMIGQRVFWNEGAVARMGNQAVDIELISWPANVGEVQGEWLWLGRDWVRLTDVRRLQEAFDFYSQEVRPNPQSASAWQRRASCWREREDSTC